MRLASSLLIEEDPFPPPDRPLDPFEPAPPEPCLLMALPFLMHGSETRVLPLHHAGWSSNVTQHLALCTSCQLAQTSTIPACCRESKCAWLARSPTRRGNSIMMLFVFLTLLFSKFLTNDLPILLKEGIVLGKQFFVEGAGIDSPGLQRADNPHIQRELERLFRLFAVGLRACIALAFFPGPAFFLSFIVGNVLDRLLASNHI